MKHIMFAIGHSTRPIDIFISILTRFAHTQDQQIIYSSERTVDLFRN